ncbi:hypothetical protein [Breoghania sp. JC706]|uniref:hypothetical protein n=1 Tax=Breoghania sp. JC706 TaxID=3117732 RepID=UPI0030083744
MGEDGNSRRPATRKPDAKPAGPAAGLRSRGFLSHGGAPAEDASGKPSRARGTRSHEGAGDGAVRPLDKARPHKPFGMKDK